MHKLRRLLRRFWGLTVSSLIFLLFGFLAPIRAADIQIRNYVVPVFPEALNRARVQASFVVEFNVKGGRIDAIRIVSQRITFAGNRIAKEGTSFPDFIKSINDALNQWTFAQSDAKQSYEQTVTIRFQLSDSKTEADASRLTFTAQEKGHMPTEITIEAAKIGSDIMYAK